LLLLCCRSSRRIGTTKLFKTADEQWAGAIPPSAIAQLKRRISMSSKWAFIGGILAGVAGVFTAAAVAVELEDRKSSNGDAVEESEQPALPENEGR
jgi:hypothetical protein